MDVRKGIIYYTDNRIGKPIIPVCQTQLLKSGLPIVSVSLKPIDFGENIVLEGRERSYPTMLKQIVMALESSTADIVYFCEHDVLYHPSHFEFTPRENTYYYNINNWRWGIKENFAIQYDGLTSLSALSCYRALALEHFTKRLNYVEAKGWDKIRSREPRWGRVMGYEPGTKPRRRGGFTDETHETWRSEFPNVDIRHKYTFSAPKIRLTDFKHTPKNWKEVNINDIPGWNLVSLFQLEERNLSGEPLRTF